MMISTTGPIADNASRHAVRAFTLVELVLVMALMVTLLAVAIPSLSRSMRGHNLDQDAERVLAATEYARDEAAAQGIPMDVWVDTASGRFGVDGKAGFNLDGADNARAKEFALGGGARFDSVGSGMIPSSTPAPTSGSKGLAAPGGSYSSTGLAAPTSMHGGVIAAEFAPDGTMDPGSVASIRIAGPVDGGVSVAQTTDGYAYQIVRDGQ